MQHNYNNFKLLLISIPFLFMSISVSAQRFKTNELRDPQFVGGGIIESEVGEFVSGGFGFGPAPGVIVDNYPIPAPRGGNGFYNPTESLIDESFNPYGGSFTGGFGGGPLGWVEGQDPNYTFDGKAIPQLSTPGDINGDFSVSDENYSFFPTETIYYPIGNNVPDPEYYLDGTPVFSTRDNINNPKKNRLTIGRAEADTSNQEDEPIILTGFENSCWSGNLKQGDVKRFCQMNLDLFAKRVDKIHNSKQTKKI